MLTTPALTDATEINPFNFTKGTDSWDPISKLISNDVITKSDNKFVSPVQISTYNNKLYVSNLKSSTRLTVYSMDGSLFFNRQLNSDASIAISKGLWIVKANSSEGSKVVKVLVK